MKNFVTIALVVIMSFSCMKEYDVVTVENQRDFLPKPTRTEVSSGNDSLMVLGPQQTNPYTVSIMQEARRLLLEENPGLEIPELTVSHYYVRFAPRDDEELYSLLQDTTILFYDFPLDREIISGTYYHDPAIVDSLPTYQYASIPAAKWISMRFSLDVELPPYEVLSLLFIPEEVEGFFDDGDDGDDGDNGGGWPGGSIVPINPWIPAPDPDDPTPINPNGLNSTNTTSTTVNIANMLVQKSMELAGLNDEEDGDEGGYHEMGSGTIWYPSGRIMAYDDIVEGYIPLEGVKVRVRRWFTTHTATTDENGYFYCIESFGKPANYCIRWDNEYWDIRDGLLGQAYYNGPKQIGAWSLKIDKDTPKSLAYATIHRAAYRFYYKNNILAKPFFMRETIGYRHRKSNESISGKYWLELGSDVLPDIRIFGFGSNDDLFTTADIFATTSHELGHAAHWFHAMLKYTLAGISGNLSLIESWAACVGYFMTTVEYEQLGVVDKLHMPWSAIKDGITTLNGYQSNKYNKQYWILPDDPDDLNNVYTPVFIDLIDDFNQKNYMYDKFYLSEVTSKLPIDTLCYPISMIEQFVFESSSLQNVRDCLTGSINQILDANAYVKRSAIIKFFEQYEQNE